MSRAGNKIFGPNGLKGEKVLLWRDMSRYSRGGVFLSWYRPKSPLMRRILKPNSGSISAVDSDRDGLCRSAASSVAGIDSGENGAVESEIVVGVFVRDINSIESPTASAYRSLRRVDFRNRFVHALNLDSLLSKTWPVVSMSLPMIHRDWVPSNALV